MGRKGVKRVWEWALTAWPGRRPAGKRARRNVRASRAQGTNAGAPRTSSERTTSIFCDESQRGILRNTTGKMSAAEHQRDSSTVQIRALGQLVCAPEKEKVWRVA